VHLFLAPHLGHGEGLALLAALAVVGAEFEDAALVVEVANQQVDDIPGIVVVEAVGMLGWAAMDIRRGFASV